MDETTVLRRNNRDYRTVRRRFVRGVCAMVMLAVSTVAGAQESDSREPADGFFLGTSINGLYNITDGPRAALGARAWYQRPIIEATGPLWDPARVEAGLTNRWAPVFNDVAAYVYLEPTAAFDVTASVGYQVQYDGLIDGAGYYRLTGYDEDPTDDISNRYATQGGTIIRIAPRFKFAMRRFVVSHTIQVTWVDYRTFAGDDDDFDFFLDGGGGIDEVLNERDVWIQNNSFVFYAAAPGLLLGGNSTIDGVPDADRRNVKLAAAAVYTRVLRRSWNLQLVALAGTYVSHRWLEGEPDVTVVVDFARPIGNANR